MAGFPRRPKPLKARVSIADLAFAEISNAVEGDLFMYGSDGLWHNTQSLTGTYTFTHGITGTALTLSGALAAASITDSGDLTVLGNTSLQALAVQGAATLNSTLHVVGAATFDSTVTITGTLAFAGFSISGDGTIAGSLTIGTTLSVTGAVTMSSTLNVTGQTTLGSAVITGNELVGGNLTVVGNISGATVSATTVSAITELYAGNDVLVGAGLTITQSNIAFFDDGTTYSTLSMGTTTLFSARTVGVLEVTGNPNGVYSAARGSIALRNDGADDSSFYIKGRGATDSTGWIPLKDWSDEFDFLFTRLIELEEQVQYLLQKADEEA